MSTAQSFSTSKKNVSISQRWPIEVRDELNRVAQALGLSATQITVECLSLFLSAHNKHPRETKIPRLLRKYLCPAQIKPASSSTSSEKIIASLDSSSSSIVKNSRRTPTRYGFKKQIILNFLKENAGRVFVNPEIAEKLGIPESTVRRYTNELAKAGLITLIPGRPNGIKYPVS